MTEKITLESGLFIDGSTEEEIRLIEIMMSGTKYSVIDITPGKASIIVYNE